MQTARPIIAEDLGPDVAKGAVSTEGVKRWNAMDVADKQVSSHFRRILLMGTSTNTLSIAMDQCLQR
jgi:hypothetical protein